MLTHILEIRDDARRCNHRRMVVLAGNREWGIKKSKEIARELDLDKKIFFTWKRDFSADFEIEELKNSEKYLGANYDLLVLDLHHSFVPNDLGKLVNIVRGGGLIVLLTPEFEKWRRSVNYFHESILTPPYKMEDMRHNFIPWVIKKMEEHEGISINENGKWKKRATRKCENVEDRNIDDSLLPSELRGLSMSSDQVRVLKECMKMDSGAVVLTADRGRGKSSVLGILTAYLIFSGSAKRVGITAPDIKNLSEFYKFLKNILNKLGVRYKERKNEIFGKNFFVEYRIPAEMKPKKYDFLIVDEAAGIPVPILLNLSRGKRVIFSTTVHGYEGTGRAFSIRFMNELKRRKREVKEIEMTEPIRYAKDDPIEKWLFDTLLLDSEPAEIDEVDVKKLKYKKYSIEELLKNEKKLREYYGIFVLAHYRNNPNDFGIICDAPNQEIRALEQDGHVVCAVQVAKEGKIEDYAEELYYGVVPPGNIVPDVMIKHYKNREFARFTGLRIVRIATHPKFMDMGIGSKMLEEISKENVDWLGSSFGATEKLLRFWAKNGFYPIHISPKKNEKTGEYSVVVLKSLSPEVKKEERKTRRDFGERFTTTLCEIHRNMELEMAREILKTLPKRGKIKLSDVEWRRLVSYAWGPGNYEVSMDIIYKIAKQYFTAKKVPKLNREQEEILIGKVLQHRSWHETGREIGRGDMYVVIEMREIMRKFIGDYDDEVSEFQRRFHGENSERRKGRNSAPWN